MTLVTMQGFDENVPEVPFNLITGRTTGRVGGQCVTINGFGALGTLPTQYASFIFGCAYQHGGYGNFGFLQFVEAGITTHVSISLDSSGHVLAWRGNTGTLLGTSTLTVPSAGVWFYIEAKIVISATVGVMQIKVNGVTFLNLTGINTKNGGTTGKFDQLVLDRVAGIQCFMDDMYIVDPTSGGAPFNDFLGDVTVQTLPANGNGDSSQWTNSAGNSTNNSTYVDDPGTSVNQTDYVKAASAGLVDLYAMTDLPQTTGTVLAVQVQTYNQKSDAGTPPTILGTMKKAASGTIATDATQMPSAGLSTTWQLVGGDLHVTDPDGSAWTIATVNALQAGVTSG